MKKIILSAFLILFCTLTFAQKLEGTWTVTLENENGSYTFFSEYLVDGDVLTGKLYSVDGEVKITDGKINGNEFEYTFELNYNTITHKGKMLDGELKMKSISPDGEFEFTMTPVKEE